MAYVLILLLGAGAGAICTFFLLDTKRRHLDEQVLHLQEQRKHVQDMCEEIAGKQQELKEQQHKAVQELASRQEELRNDTRKLQKAWGELQARKVSFEELQNENALLKRDLRNIEMSRRKTELDRVAQHQRQEALDQRGNELGRRFLQDNIKWIGTALNANNFVACKQRLQAVIAWCRQIGLTISDQEEADLVADLKAEYEKVVRAALEREEQARIRARIREEQQLQREIDRELQQLERERAAIQAALDQALAEAKNLHSAEVEKLRARLAEAEAKAQRAISQAQLTKAGNVYVISNIGSFGEQVFKIGLTRRLEPLDRVRELGDASVPFPFDVHMMISSQDAPALETALHRAFHSSRLNRVNPRKEFFRVSIEEIRRVVEEHHGQVEYVAEPEALEYRQSLSISAEDQEYIEELYEKLEEAVDAGIDEE